MKEVEYKVLSQLLRDSRISDRELARRVGTSQPTVTRTRNKLVKEGFIREYTLFPDFGKIGYQIMAVTLARARVALAPEDEALAKDVILTNPEVVFVAHAEGMGKNGIMISLHKSYTDYTRFMANLRLKTGPFMEEVDTILVVLDASSMVKPPSLANLLLGVPSDGMARHQRKSASKRLTGSNPLSVASTRPSTRSTTG